MRKGLVVDDTLLSSTGRGCRDDEAHIRVQYRFLNRFLCGRSRPTDSQNGNQPSARDPLARATVLSSFGGYNPISRPKTNKTFLDRLWERIRHGSISITIYYIVINEQHNIVLFLFFTYNINYLYDTGSAS